MKKHTVEIAFKHRYRYNMQGLPIWWQWCMDTIGPPNNSQYGCPASKHFWGWDSQARTMWFANPAHATLFALRWS